MPPPAVNTAIGSTEGVAHLLHGEQVSDALSITAASVASFASYAAVVLGPHVLPAGYRFSKGSILLLHSPQSRGSCARLP